MLSSGAQLEVAIVSSAMAANEPSALVPAKAKPRDLRDDAPQVAIIVTLPPSDSLRNVCDMYRRA